MRVKKLAENSKNHEKRELHKILFAKDQQIFKLKSFHDLNIFIQSQRLS